jgi:tetratricopeptide (TPR) repeat protein
VIRAVRLVSALSLLACALVALPAHAEPLSKEERTLRAKTHFQIGIKHFNLGEYDAAMVDFEKGYAYQPLPLLLYNAGQAALRAGKPEAALDLFRRFLAAEPEAIERKQVEKLMVDCEHKIAERPPAPPPSEPSTEPPPPPPPLKAAPPPLPAAPPQIITIYRDAPTPPRRSHVLPHAWLWPSLAVALGVGLGVGLTLGLQPHPNYPGSDLGTINFVP